MDNPDPYLLILDREMTSEFFSKLIGITESVSKGLSAQYFVAYNVLEDLSAKISHGNTQVADVSLSDTGIELLQDLLSEISAAEHRFLEEDLRYLEIKTFGWSYEKFRKAIYSYRNRNQAPNLFVGISLLMRIPKSSEERTMFNKIKVSYIVGVVCFMAAETVEKSTKKNWEAMNKLLKDHFPDSDFEEANIDATLSIMTFKEQLSQKDDIEELKKNDAELKKEIKLLKETNENLTAMVKKILKLLEE